MEGWKIGRRGVVLVLVILEKSSFVEKTSVSTLKCFGSHCSLSSLIPRKGSLIFVGVLL